MRARQYPPLRTPIRKPLKQPFIQPLSLDPSCVLALLPQQDNKWWDHSSNNLHATLNNLSWANGPLGQTLIFDGSSSYASIPHSLILDAGADDNFSFAFWFYKTSAVETFIFLKHTSADNSGYILYHSEAGLVSFLTYSFGDIKAAISDPVPLDTWHHGVAVRNQTDGYVMIYIDGYFVNQMAESSRTLTNLGAFNIGATEVPDMYFPGRLNHILVFNRVLSPNEILNLYELERVS